MRYTSFVGGFLYVLRASVSLIHSLTKFIKGLFQGCLLYRFEKLNDLIDELVFCVWVVDALSDTSNREKCARRREWPGIDTSARHSTHITHGIWMVHDHTENANQSQQKFTGFDPGFVHFAIVVFIKNIPFHHPDDFTQRLNLLIPSRISNCCAGLRTCCFLSFNGVIDMSDLVSFQVCRWSGKSSRTHRSNDFAMVMHLASLVRKQQHRVGWAYLHLQEVVMCQATIYAA